MIGFGVIGLGIILLVLVATLFAYIGKWGTLMQPPRVFECDACGEAFPEGEVACPMCGAGKGDEG